MKFRLAGALAFAALLVPICAFALDTTPPGKCNDLAIDGVGPHTVVLTWTNSGDDNYTGTATWYVIKMSTSPIDDSNWGSATFVTSAQPGAAGTSACFPIENLQRDSTYYFAIKFIDEVDQESPVSNSPHTTTPHSGPEVSC